MNTLTKEQYEETKGRNDRHNAWVDSIKRRSYRAEEVPADCQITNEERSKLEVYEFVHNPPDKYFLYINQEKRLATTWTGDKLGEVTFGREYSSPAFGAFSRRIPITVVAINGKVYHGTYYKSSGDYARIKAKKESKKTVDRRGILV
jgi:hypothetical protein